MKLLQTLKTHGLLDNDFLSSIAFVALILVIGGAS